ncbi:MAG: type III-A CRISPR-associated protein Cas10/Csm1 [Nitrospirae bacterium]|nr:type III-A CRISPR-associated protein Cas10/Csm1 [Nitrospirota bacterium]
MKDFNQKEYQTVILGALLHDVGKMLQRGNFRSLDTKGKHPQVSSVFVSAFKDFFSRFVDVDLLQTLVQRHHEDSRLGENLICQNAPEKYRALSYLVSRADNYSSSERGEKAEDYQDFKSVPLVSIFSRIDIGKALPEKLRYRAKPLNPEETFPEKFDEYDSDELNNHLQYFGEEFSMLVKDAEHTTQGDFYNMFANIFTILMRYTWCIPSNTQEEIPDVSLFDHLKTTCAIAACLYQYHFPDLKESEIKNDKTDKFILLVSDLSGIQNYIFNVTHIGAGGVAKRLRARSFQINLLSEIVSHKILHVFNLPLANILMSSGGKFYILLPNVGDGNSRITALKKEIDTWFYKKFNAEINLNIETTCLSGDAFDNYGEILRKLNQSLQRMKKKPFNELLTGNGLWNENMAALNIDFGDEEKLCKACNKFPGEMRDGKFICDKCEDDKIIGQKLPKIKYIVFYKNNTGEFKNYLDYSFDLLDDVSHVKYGAYLILSIEEFITDSRLPMAHRFIANYISTFISIDECSDCKDNIVCSEKDHAREGQPKFFECIANESTGRKMLGYLKADVDNLGGVFACGLRDGQKDIGTVSRIATLSRMLDIFFSGYMQKLIEDNYPELYTVYSGGDDLLVIGPWDSIIKFADELNSEFRRFTCNNKNLTLSAGIAFVKHSYPVFRAVEMANNYLNISKANTGKDSLMVFGQTIKWREVPEIIKESEKLSNWLKDKQISSGFANNLLYYSQMNNKFRENRQTEYLRFLPLMTYDIARNISIEKREIRTWAESLKDLNNTVLLNLGIIASFALTANRGKKDE